MTTAPKLSSARPISVERLPMRYLITGKRPNTVVEIEFNYGICGECRFSEMNYFFEALPEIRFFSTLCW